MRMGRGYSNKGVVPAMEALFWNWRAWLMQWGVVYAMKAWSRRCMGVACWGRGLTAMAGPGALRAGRRLGSGVTVFWKNWDKRCLSGLGKGKR